MSKVLHQLNFIPNTLDTYQKSKDQLTQIMSILDYVLRYSEPLNERLDYVESDTGLTVYVYGNGSYYNSESDNNLIGIDGDMLRNLKTIFSNKRNIYYNGAANSFTQWNIGKNTHRFMITYSVNKNKYICKLETVHKEDPFADPFTIDTEGDLFQDILVDTIMRFFLENNCYFIDNKGNSLT